MEKDILSLIEKESAGFSKSQRKIAAFITQNYDKAAFMTAARLGSTVGVSESTVVRFAAELGYDGYPEMRKALQDMVRNCLTSVQRIEAARGLLENQDILSAVLNSDIDQIRITMEETNRDDFNSAVDAIVRADHVYIFGLRSSAAIAGFMGFYFNFLFENVRVVNENSVSEVFEQILRIGKNDVMIALSFPRYSKRTIKAMRYARDRQATVIGITDNENSPIAEIADIPLCARSDMVSFVDSLVGPLSLVNALIVAVSTKAKGSELETDFNRLEAIWAEYDVYEKSDI
ncbi:MAG: MurR/RpiR family transcriptional regulator [Oscillospiraceae bacterium]|nr:MurR/RpiR family transcriptional regulator [Oscillospiraceae bacterium]